MTAVDLNWVALDRLVEKRECSAKIRSTQQPVSALISPCENGNVKVDFEDYQKSIAVGQSVVFYDGDIVLGGGVIDKVE